MSQIVLTIITAGVSSVVAAVVGAAVARVKTMRRARDEARDAAERMELLVRQNTIMTCRLCIYSDKFSTDEKIDAYKIYRDQHANHQTRTYMSGLVGMDIDRYIELHEGR